jgi:LuxR family transcriptional regulator, quorum-sensing system regulator BjaR1
MKRTIIALPIAEPVKDGKPKRALSDREKEVLQWQADGKCNKEIAGILEIEPSTIDTHNRNIVKALTAANMKHAVAIGIRNKIIH